MKKSEDGLSAYARMKKEEGTYLHCNCGFCRFCRARMASILALEHLSMLITGERCPNPKMVGIADMVLNPEKENITPLIKKLKGLWGEERIDVVLRTAEKYRNCTTIKEAMRIFRSKAFKPFIPELVTAKS